MATNPFAEATAYGMLVAVAERHGARPAILCGDERITFADLRARADALAGGLAALGLRRGDALAIWLPNRPLWFVAQYAAARLGVIVVALNPRYRARELTYILHQSDATALLLTDHLGPIDYFEILHEVIPELADAVPGELTCATLPKLRHVLVDAEDPYPGCLRAFCRGKIASFKIPRRIRFVADVPRTPSPHGDKVQRMKLRELAIKELTP